MRNNLRSVAIDGPAGAGKSTIARYAAKKFGFLYVDTGAIYRTVGLAVLNAGIDSKDEKGVTSILPKLEIEICYDDSGSQRMLLNGGDVTDEIRQPAVSIFASDVSAMAEIRRFLLDMQRQFAKSYDVIMDGRDIGTLVLPEADLKIFLTASAEDRAKRRYLEMRQKGIETTLDEVYRDMEYRDKSDSSRTTAPLTAAADAIIVDTSGNNLEQSIEFINSLIARRFGL